MLLKWNKVSTVAEDGAVVLMLPSGQQIPNVHVVSLQHDLTAAISYFNIWESISSFYHIMWNFKF